MYGLETDNFGSFDVVTEHVTVVKRLPNDGVALRHLEFGLIRFLCHHKTREAEKQHGNQCFFHVDVV